MSSENTPDDPKLPWAVRTRRAWHSYWASVRSDFRSLFATGLLVIIPLWVTWLTITFVVGLLDSFLDSLPKYLKPETYIGWELPFVDILFAVLFIVTIGFFARNLLGRRAVRYGENLIARIPLVRNVYTAIKQFTYTLLGGKKRQFDRAVLFEYPLRGVWSIGFVTNHIEKPPLVDKVPPNSLAIFIPTTPNPTSGWFLIVPESDTRPLNISVEDAFKIIISGGVVIPGQAHDDEDDPSMPAKAIPPTVIE
ncbi:MAG: DUF502 domain-containing protein [Deltaproteobacteria bacterium]|nr:DUF502 domain-containing protein [Deltaproteobacteria bacterium]MCB9490094.1 DUF502 domain-containing protein [Deltaproteobacteria bacterium]